MTNQWEEIVKNKSIRKALSAVLAILAGIWAVKANSIFPFFVLFIVFALFADGSIFSSAPSVPSSNRPSRRIPSIEETNRSLGLAPPIKKEKKRAIEPQESKPAPILEKPKPIHQITFAEAKSDIDDIEMAAAASSGGLSKSLNIITDNIQKIMREINDDPQQFSNVSRLFTYYVPEICNLLKVRGALVKQKDKVKIKEIDTMIGRLAAVSNDFLDKVEDIAIGEIDIDLKLLDQSLAQEIKIEINENA